MQFLRKYLKVILLVCIFTIAFFIWQAAAAESRSGVTVAFLDVGQGDSIFIEGPKGKQVLIDGGASKKVLSRLNALMPFYDRSIDVVIATHPDLDHIGGLVPVAERYEIGLFMEPGLARESAAYTELAEAAREKDVVSRNARAGQRIVLNDGAYIEILFPEADVAGWDANTASVVARLVYGDAEVLLTGDAPKSIEQYLVGRYGRALEADILKVGHHGSDTSTSALFLAAVSPEIAVISAGADNRYGHPHEDVVGRIQSFGADIFSTAEEGSVIFELDEEGVQRTAQ